MPSEPVNSPSPDLSGAQTLEDGPSEAQRIIAAGTARGLTLRLLGGVAVRLRCPHASHRALTRVYADMDFVAPKKQARALRDLLQELGYTADRRFNALHGERRLLFFDETRGRQIDIFLSVFEMCQKLDLEKRLSDHPLTLSPADLLLTKLQIVELNAKDIQDILAILLDFPPVAHSDKPGDELDIATINDLTSQNWGWFTSVNDNLDRAVADSRTLLTPEEAETVTQRAAAIKRQLEESPKSLAWRARALVGRRVEWYELPEEVHR
ncbi:MAG TPA: hypothetical protein VF808_12790 [Ktedonobacterales bacterium]